MCRSCSRNGRVRGLALGAYVVVRAGLLRDAFRTRAAYLSFVTERKLMAEVARSAIQGSLFHDTP
jgi:hypothetical protein